jgi:hypothetical protein
MYPVRFVDSSVLYDTEAKTGGKFVRDQFSNVGGKSLFTTYFRFSANTYIVLGTRNTDQDGLLTTSSSNLGRTPSIRTTRSSRTFASTTAPFQPFGTQFEDVFRHPDTLEEKEGVEMTDVLADNPSGESDLITTTNKPKGNLVLLV